MRIVDLSRPTNIGRDALKWDVRRTPDSRHLLYLQKGANGNLHWSFH